MKVTVKLIGPFVQAFGFSEKDLECPAGTTADGLVALVNICLLYTSPSPRDGLLSRMPSSA